jgi:hemerythrin-like domain-containing protein
MLTVTYSLVTISAEQKNVRNLLFRLRQDIENCLKKLQELDLTKVEAILNKLAQFDRYSHARKVEVYVIPAIRGTAHEVDLLLAELESMSAQAIVILKAAQERLRQAFVRGIDEVRELYRAMQVYCDSLLNRLAKEEEELLPMVGRLLSIDEWFPIAAQFLSDDDNARRRNAPFAPQLPA